MDISKLTKYILKVPRLPNIQMTEDCLFLDGQPVIRVTGSKKVKNSTNSEASISRMELREALADYAHEAWSGWMKYLFSKSVSNPDGSVTIPEYLVSRWRWELGTKYKDLPEAIKESDRMEADKILAIFRELDRSSEKLYS